ncbi:hypothetical protein [Comamonas sp.]|nr:hypothetical protein [Comamonas sp.]
MYAICNPNAFSDALGLDPERGRLKDTAEKIKSAKEGVEGAQQVHKGANKIKTEKIKQRDIGACVLDSTLCNLTGDQMQDIHDRSKRVEQSGLKDIANGSVNIYKNTPGTIGNGAPSIK